MTSAKTDDEPGDDRKALRTAEAALSRIQRYAEAAQDGHLTSGEAVEQILDEMAAGPALSRVRRALGRSFSPSRPH
jgi:hypothetical protein